jgi:glycosyltransferase involved in cell wall biosynthesis
VAHFTVLTPCFNAERYIVETARSVLGQSALASGATLQYLVLDGGSTDSTVARLQALGDPRLEVISAPDRGMYDALAKGLRRAEGEIVSYLNAGDYYHPSALEIVGDVFAHKREVRWLTGLNVRYTAASWAVHFHLPYRYRQSLFECGAYGNQLPFVQQESTFWSRELTALVDLDELSTFKLAGDYLLWRRFAGLAPLRIVEAYLGGFRTHPGQLSERLDAYRAEMRRVTRPPGPRERALAAADKLLWSAPAAVKKQLNPELLRYDFAAQSWS